MSSSVRRTAGHGTYANSEFWKLRAAGYNKLEWATRSDYLEWFLAHGDFKPTDVVLDAGTGTGVVAHAVAPLVTRVIGIDLSLAMLSQALDTKHNNEEFVLEDIRSLRYPAANFDKITARMVFHHILTDTVHAVRECHRVLVPGGRMLLSEGVPPHESLKAWYREMFTLKEERLTFMPQDLVNLMQQGGFACVSLSTYVLPQVSVRNWLENSGLPQPKQNAIMRMHVELDGAGQKFYNMKVLQDDVLIDMQYVTVLGVKASVK